MSNDDRKKTDLAVREVYHAGDLERLQKDLQEYIEKFNFLSPVQVIDWIPDFYSISAVRIPVDTRVMQDGGEVYEVGYAKEKKDKTFSLAKSPIERVAMAAGADIISTVRTDDRSDPHYCEFKAIVAIPDVGTNRARRVEGDGEIDLREGSDLCQKIEREAERSYQALCRKAERENWRNKPRKKDPKIRIGEMRATIVRRCQTAAILRAYRRGFGIKQHYTYDEMQKPFLILRLVETGRVYSSDPAEARKAREDYRRMALARMAGASDALFGYQREPEVITATAIPVDETVDKDPGNGGAEVGDVVDPFDGDNE